MADQDVELSAIMQSSDIYNGVSLDCSCHCADSPYLIIGIIYDGFGSVLQKKGNHVCMATAWRAM